MPIVVSLMDVINTSNMLLVTGYWEFTMITCRLVYYIQFVVTFCGFMFWYGADARASRDISLALTCIYVVISALKWIV